MENIKNILLIVVSLMLIFTSIKLMEAKKDDNMTYNVLLGHNAGIEITDEKHQIRIGNFTREESFSGVFEDCVINDNGRVVVKKNVLDFLELDYLSKQ